LLQLLQNRLCLGHVGGLYNQDTYQQVANNSTNTLKLNAYNGCIKIIVIEFVCREVIINGEKSTNKV
jgi:hypothetical protein